MAFKRRDEPASIEDERATLRAQRHELESLKRELAERVAAVRERERDLQVALAEAGGPRTGVRDALPPNRPAEPGHAEGEHEAALEQRGRRLLEREQAVAERERAATERAAELDRREGEIATRLAQTPATPTGPAPEPDADRLALIESRLGELREAERLFLRTRDELASRSEALSARERLVGQKEQELDDREDGAGRWAGPELTELEERLRRLEQRRPGEETLGFSGGLRRLQEGSKRPQRGG